MPKIRALKPDFWTDDAVVELSPHARLLFMGLWTYACDNGHLEDKPRQIKMRILPADDVSINELLDELTTSGRIIRRNGWIVVVNFSKHQKVDKRFFVACQRPGCTKPGAKTATSQPEPRSEHDVPPPSDPRDHHEGVHDGGDGVVVVDGVVDGDGDTSRELTLHEAPRADVDRICVHLADRIEANGSKRPTISGRWRDAARLMLDADDRTEAEVHGAIDWCQADEFWRANILSLPKLRDKYDQLRLQASRESQNDTRTSRRQQETDGMFGRAMARAEAKMQGGPA